MSLGWFLFFVIVVPYPFIVWYTTKVSRENRLIGEYMNIHIIDTGGAEVIIPVLNWGNLAAAITSRHDLLVALNTPLKCVYCNIAYRKYHYEVHGCPCCGLEQNTVRTKEPTMFYKKMRSVRKLAKRAKVAIELKEMKQKVGQMDIWLEVNNNKLDGLTSKHEKSEQLKWDL